MFGACVLIGYVNIRDVSADLMRFNVLKRSIFHSGAETKEICEF
jgi:hypothetical protein